MFWKRLWSCAAFSALFLLSALVTLLVLLSGENRTDAATGGEDVPLSSIEQLLDDFSESGVQARQSTGIGAGEALGMQDFILPLSVKADSTEPYLLRPRLERWREEQVDRFWIPLEDIAADLVRRENDRRIEQLFEDIP